MAGGDDFSDEVHGTRLGSDGFKGEESDGFSFDLEAYRSAVFRDLDWLLNTVAPARPEEIADFPRAAASTVNYGVLAFAGTSAVTVEARVLEKRFREAGGQACS